jgi:transposase
MEDALSEARHNAKAYRRAGVAPGHIHRYRWRDAEKSRIVAESFKQGANISEVARRNGVNRGVLSTWRKEASRLMADAGVPAFAPAVVVEEGHTTSSPAHLANEAFERRDRSVETTGMIEIDFAGARIRVPVGADLNTLATVFAAVRRAP